MTQKENKELPGCSEYLKGLSAEFQSFIAAPSRADPLFRGRYAGDNRDFASEPSNEFRTSYEVGFDGSGTPYNNFQASPSYLERWSGNATIFPPNSVPNLDNVSGAYTDNSGNIRIRHYPTTIGVAGVPGSGMTGPIAQASNLTIDMSTGFISGSITHSASPSFQMFINGSEIWRSSEPKSDFAFALGIIMQSSKEELINAQICDPDK